MYRDSFFQKKKKKTSLITCF